MRYYATDTIVRTIDSEKLNDEVEKWLASGGKIQTLNHGESLGRMDYSRNYDAEKRKVEVKKEKPKPVEKPSNPVKVKIAKPPKPKKQKPLSAEGKRVKNLKEAKMLAVQKGLTEFKAECKNHGMTDYLIYGDGSAKCILCKKDKSVREFAKTMTPEKRIQYERRKANNQLMKIAVENGEKNFIGNCEKHGKTDFVILKKSKASDTEFKFMHRCKCCKIDINNASIERRKK